MHNMYAERGLLSEPSIADVRTQLQAKSRIPGGAQSDAVIDWLVSGLGIEEDQ